MIRYFKAVEIKEDEFIEKTGEVLDCCQLVIPVDNEIFVAIDEEDQDEIEIPIYCFD